MTVGLQKTPAPASSAREYDVAVVGGTAAAVGAALAAREAGADVVLLAPGGALSDDLAGKLVLDFGNARWTGCAFNDALYNSLGGPFVSCGDATPLLLKRVADDALAGAGIPVRTFAAATDVLHDAAGRVAGVRVVSRSGVETFRAACVVDATERAGLARRAGAKALPFAGGAVAFERRIVAGEAPDGVAVRELPATRAQVRCGGVPQSPAATVVASRYFSCLVDLPMADLGARPLLAAEQVARDLTWTPSTLDAAETLRFFPPDRIAETPEGVFVASLVGEPDEAKARARHVSVVDDAEAAAGIGRLAAAFAKAAERPGPVAADGAEPPVVAECDVFVAGAGTAGAPAAIVAAREGMRTIVADPLHRMGGVATEGLIGSYCHGNTTGFTAEIDAHVKGFGAVYSVAKAEWLRKECRAAGAEVWFGTSVVGARTEECAGGWRLRAVEIVFPDGSRGLVRARAFIDATGNADLAAAAGEETEFLSDGELSLQGAGSTPRVLGSSYRNTDCAFVDDTDAADLSFFTARARRSMPLWAWDQSGIVNSRERRRIAGAFRLSVQDVLLGRKHPDTVAVAKSNFDTHGQTADAQFFVDDPSRDAIETCVPYRCFLPKSLEGLLVVGLGMSAHRDAMPLLRMQPDVQNYGCVAALAAAEAIRSGVEVRDVDIPRLQKRLVERGVLPAEMRGCRDTLPLSDAALDEAVAALPGGYKGLAAVLGDPGRSLPRLRAAHSAAKGLGDGNAALVHAHVLGLLGDGTGAETLARAVDGFASWDAGWNYKGMDQFGRSVSDLDSYVIALGRTRGAAAFDSIAAKARLLAPEDAYSHFRAVALAFEALGDARGAAELSRLLALPGVAGNAAGADGLGPIPGYGLYSRLNLGLGDAERGAALRELSLARALFRLGDTPSRTAERILEAYAADPRRAFANHALKVLGKRR